MGISMALLLLPFALWFSFCLFLGFAACLCIHSGACLLIFGFHWCADGIMLSLPLCFMRLVLCWVTPLCLEILCSVPCVCTSCFFVACSSTLWARSPCSFAPRSALQPPGGNQVDGLPPAPSKDAASASCRFPGRAPIHIF